MVMDPGRPGKTKPPARAAREPESAANNGLRPIIERLVSSERFCHEVISQTANSRTLQAGGGDAYAAEPAEPTEFGRDGRAPFDIRQPLQRLSTRRSRNAMQRFIGVLDTVYSRILTDGDFDFSGFMRARGLQAGDMIDVLEAAAVRLGEEWRCDTKGFVRVTIGISRLQRILTQIAQENRCYECDVHDRSALVVVPQGETHLFAAALLEERFHLAKWETRTVIDNNAEDLRTILKNGDFSVICLVWLDETLKNRVEALLGGIRAGAAGSNAMVLAGGFAAMNHASWLVGQGVERVCSDAALAIDVAAGWCEIRGEGRTARRMSGSDREPVQSA